MTRIILLRTCATDFDDEGRIKGILNIPLNSSGTAQATEIADDLRHENVAVVYYSPCQSGEETADVIANGLGVKSKALKNLHNLDQGLWQGKRIDELKEKHKKVYKQGQEQPETVCPPGGEMVTDAQVRVKTAMDKLVKKHKQQVIALIAPEPLISLLHSYLSQTELGDLWETVCECGNWMSIDVEANQLTSMAANQV